MATTKKAPKYVYFFGNKKADGNRGMKELLGGKGANLAEMTKTGVPVPAGMTLTTEVCAEYYENKKRYPKELKGQVEDALNKIEKAMGTKLGDKKNPLLLSVRSGAAQSMPGMMDTILNLGINENVVKALSEKASPRFAWDSYRRFIQMFGSVAMGVSHDVFEHLLEDMKEKKGVEKDTDLSAEDLEELVKRYLAAYEKEKGKAFPTNPKQQLWDAITAVFNSWKNPRAIEYLRINDIKGLIGTAVNVQAMVFGNMGESSATGVCFSRDPATGENAFYGEFLINAQGEDVVAGIRTPQKMSLKESRSWADQNGIKEEERKVNFPSMEELMKPVYKELVSYKSKLENHYRDMQDMEFTVQEGKLYMLQTRNGKRTGAAAVKIAVDMVKEKLITEEEALLRVEPDQIEQLLHPNFAEGMTKNPIAQGMNASPGAAVGRVAFTADQVVEYHEQGEPSILVRIETSPEDIKGMNLAVGILTQRGGATSHAAVVARQLGTPCVCGCGVLKVDYAAKSFSVGGKSFNKGEFISIDGSTGEVMGEKLETVQATLSGDFAKVMKWADKHATMKVRTNADQPADAKRAVEYGAKGIGLCRTEHMFFEEDRIWSVRKMILSNTVEEREAALKEIEPLQRKDFQGLFEAMNGLPVIIRFLDPPLHEFLPHSAEEQKEMAQRLNVSEKMVKDKVESLHEFNPMLGFRGCRLSIVYPEILEMQTRAVVDAAIALKKAKKKIIPEIMIPLVGNNKELKIIADDVRALVKSRLKAAGVSVKILVGTMIEVPRAAITADEIAETADFFSFGTNDLTQMTCGFSRDDSGTFLGEYVKKGIYEYDPFQVLDQDGVGEILKLAVEKGRKVNPDIELGICGEHGGEPKTVEFCHKVGLDYVSCSPLRVPVARLVAAQAALKGKKKPAKKAAKKKAAKKAKKK